MLKKSGFLLFLFMFVILLAACSTSGGNVDVTPYSTRDIPVVAPVTEVPSAEPTILPTTPIVTEKPTSTPKPTNKVDSEKPMICLTFDDGPNTPSTGKILDVLEANHARATFFVVGNRIEKHHTVIERAHKLGCEIGNHTFDHKKKLTELDKDGLYAEINQTDELLFKYIGTNTPFIRPPGGSYNSETLKMVDRPLVNWNVDTLDWKTRNKNAIIQEVIGKVKDGDIVLMHDLYSTTADAVEYIVPKLLEQGFQLVTLTEMFEAKGYTMERGYIYFFAGEKGIRH
ncbi:MAG: polysaccharide deacetylase family protein [Clostridia bacterium]